MKTLCIGLLAALASSPLIAAPVPATAPVPILPGSLHWGRPPAIPGAELSWLLGGEKLPGAYVMRARLAPGTRVAPHTHPDTRHSTVLAGTLYVGFGEQFDESRLVAIPTGALYVAPANTPHFIWARDGEVLYQESGTAPTGTVPVAPRNAP